MVIPIALVSIELTFYNIKYKCNKIICIWIANLHDLIFKFDIPHKDYTNAFPIGKYYNYTSLLNISMACDFLVKFICIFL